MHCRCLITPSRLTQCSRIRPYVSQAGLGGALPAAPGQRAQRTGQPGRRLAYRSLHACTAVPQRHVDRRMQSQDGGGAERRGAETDIRPVQAGATWYVLRSEGSGSATQGLRLHAAANFSAGGAARGLAVQLQPADHCLYPRRPAWPVDREQRPGDLCSQGTEQAPAYYRLSGILQTLRASP
ncbi:hypothetical protein D3C77_431900 [compost metagenome]